LIKKFHPAVEFNPPASARQIKAAERKLAVRFPGDLVNLLFETDGVEDWQLSTDAIVATNLEHRNDRVFRSIYSTLEGLLFFLADGTGSYYAYPICEGRCDLSRTMYWDHETDERTFAGNTLADVIRRWLGIPMTSVAWPPLARIGSVAGRVANPADLKKGNAAFVLDPAGEPAPIDVEIPQYVYKVDHASGEHVPAVLIQAEVIGDLSLYGLKFIEDNAVGICLTSELTMLGSTIR
jgi:cell wall assembly regulator SMI1